jgi:glyoxylase-like metal-dependent hydrolase (beta-lactamase superfamily II)
MIDTIILSHLHFDHVANVELFPDAQIITHQAGLRYAQQQADRDLALSSWLTDALLASPKLTIIDAEPELWPNLRIIQTPGHTDGCISVVLTINQKTWVLAADAVKTRAELLTGQTEVGFDLVASRESIGRIWNLADWVVPGHDVPLRLSSRGVEPDGITRFEVTGTLPGDEATVRLEF